MPIAFAPGPKTTDGKQTHIPYVENTSQVNLPVKSKVQDEMFIVTEYGVKPITPIQARALDHSRNLLIHLVRRR